MIKNMYRLQAKVAKIYEKTMVILADKRGVGFVENAISILISVVIGSLLLAGLYALFGEQILPELQNRIKQMFDYSG